MEYNFDRCPSRIGTESVKWDEYAPDVLPLWVADMDFEAAPAILAALRRRVEHGVFGYELVPQDYFDAIASWFSRRHGWEGITREQVIPTTGVIPAYSAAIKAFTRPGDRVIVQTPCYNAFFPAVRNNGCREAVNPLLCRDGRFEMNFEELEELASDGRTTAMLLCNPHNPVGRVWTREELLRAGEICLRHGVFVISDEIHCELTRPGTGYVPFATLPDELVRNSCTCCSPTKPFNIAGIQIANVIARDPDVVRRIDRAINDNECCDVNVFGVAALKAAYNESEGWLDALRAYLWENERLVRETFARELPCVTMPALEGTYLMWLDCRALCHFDRAKRVEKSVSERLAAHLRDNAKVALSPGSWYGEAGEGYLRLNIACPRATLAEGLSRLISGLRSFSLLFLRG